MITVRRHGERQHLGDASPETWHTFHPLKRAGVRIRAFGALAHFDEFRLPPGAAIPTRPRRNAEKVTYVRHGSLEYRDSAGQSGLLSGGDFQCRSTALGTRHTETNPSRTEWAQVFQIWLGPSLAILEPGHVDRRFTAADRHGLLLEVASSTRGRDSLELHQNAFVYATLLDVGTHVVHALAPDRCAWLHQVHGSSTVAGVDLQPGDGLGASELYALSITATVASELLLIDLPAAGGRGSTNGRT